MKHSISQKLFSAFLILFLVFQTISGILFLPKIEKAKAASDWLTGWDYRTPVVTDSGVTLSNYQVKVTLQGTNPSASNYIDFDKTLSNGADIRFTDSDKTTQIPYWIESWDSNAKTATVWVKVPTVPASSTPDHFRFNVSSANHNDYRLSYPVTYEFNIPASSSGLKAYKKYTEAGTWTQITEKTSSDFFNGIEAVRFDYTNNKAYVSIAFDANSDDVYLKIVNTSGTPVVTYQKIDQYYDNRTAAVVVTGDDWWPAYDSYFSALADLLAQDKIWFSAGVVTNFSGYPPSWSLIQSKIDAGYLEPISHSKTHPNNVPYADYDSEIGGSKTDLINNLNLPSLNKKGSQEYIYGWIEPSGQSDSTVRAKLGQYKYLSDRSTSANQDTYAAWDSTNGLYNRVGFSSRIDDQNLCSWASVFPGTTALNNKFDSVVTAGGIYTIYSHPYCFTTSEISPHLDYIKNRTNIWYVGFGHLYLYNFTAQRAVQRVAVSGNTIYLYYGKSGSTSSASYDNTFTKDYGESGLAGLWHMDEQVPGTELLTDGGLETWTNSTTLTNWTNDSASTGVRDITQESTNKQAGSYSVKLTATTNPSTNFGIYQNITTVSGEKYQVNFYQYYSSRTAGTLKIEAWDNTNSVSLGSQSITSAGTALSFTSFRFTSTNTTNVRIKVYLNSETTGTAYVDSLSVKQSSNTLADSSGNSNTGTIYGASRTATDGGQWSNRSDAVFSTGSALQFDGIDDYVDAGNGASLNITNAITIEAWVKPQDTTNDKAIVAKRLNAASWWSYGLYQNSGNFIGRVETTGGTAALTADSNYTIGQWYHIVFTYDGNVTKLYINGLAQSNQPSITGTLTPSAYNVYIGSWSALSKLFNGTIDEVRIYNRALSADEILAQYQRRKYNLSDPSRSPSINPSSALRGYTKLFKGVTNTISTTDYISYSAEPSVSNLVSSNLSFTPPSGSIDTHWSSVNPTIHP